MVDIISFLPLSSAQYDWQTKKCSYVGLSFTFLTLFSVLEANQHDVGLIKITNIISNMNRGGDLPFGDKNP